MGISADLLALVLSTFVLTTRNTFDPERNRTAEELCAVVRGLFPWCDALFAAESGDHVGVKAVLEVFRPR